MAVQPFTHQRASMSSSRRATARVEQTSESSLELSIVVHVNTADATDVVRRVVANISRQRPDAPLVHRGGHRVRRWT